MKYHFNKLKNGLEIVFSTILIISCLHNYLNAPTVICSLLKCDNSLSAIITVKSIFSRSLAIACFISRIATVYISLSDVGRRYRMKTNVYELYFPTNVNEINCRRLFTATVVLVCAMLILPTNVLRVYLICYNTRDFGTLLFQIMMYAQNLSLCSAEIYFIVRCFGLYRKFQLINEDLAAIKLETIIRNKYPMVLWTKGRADDSVVSVIRPAINQENGVSQSSRHSADNIELLRMRHQFVRGDVVELNDLYGIQLGLSLCVLFVMALIDIYEEVSGTVNTKTRSRILIYGWLLQYVYRFCAIVITTHLTTKQVGA